ncbi:MAG: hypothetical protein H7A33_07310 [Deltaproteobacteria bacterium]|nr:hypothetical protein [Deltaproteobacteria bacterium]
MPLPTNCFHFLGINSFDVLNTYPFTATTLASNYRADHFLSEEIEWLKYLNQNEQKHAGYITVG